MDGKALLVKGSRQEIPITETERRAILTMSYTVSGRLLLTESFSRFNKEVLHDLSRIYPFHASTLSPRPVDAFIHEFPNIYDFAISPQWHQVVLYNEGENSKEISLQLSGEALSGALGLNAEKQYYLYDFWNERFAGMYDGSSSVPLSLDGGEARVISIHQKQDHPQFISTNRHMMQGYVDLIVKPVWNPGKMELTGTSAVITDEAYSVVIALNGFLPVSANSDQGRCELEPLDQLGQLARITLHPDQTAYLKWSIKFSENQ